MVKRSRKSYTGSEGDSLLKESLNFRDNFSWKIRCNEGCLRPLYRSEHNKRREEEFLLLP